MKIYENTLDGIFIMTKIPKFS